MDEINESTGPDFDTAGGTESAHTDTANVSVTGSAATDDSTPKEVKLLNKWFFMEKVVSDPKLSRCAVACAFHLVNFTTTEWAGAWPGYAALAKLTGSHRRTVIDAVKRFIDLNYFEVEKGNGRRTNYYRPNSSLMVKETAQFRAGDEKATSPVVQTPPLQGVEVKSTAPNTSYIPVAPSVGDIEV